MRSASIPVDIMASPVYHEPNMTASSTISLFTVSVTRSITDEALTTTL
jgi:hypothetical protein